MYQKLYDPTTDRTELVRDIEQSAANGLLHKPAEIFLYLHAGDVERAMKLFAEGGVGTRSFLAHLWRAEHQATRQHPYFPVFVKRLGLIAYWQAFGFPDLCQPKDDDGIKCD